MKARSIISYILTAILVYVYAITIIDIVNKFIQGTFDLFDDLLHMALMYWLFAAWYSFCIWLHPDFNTDRGFWQCVRDTFVTPNGLSWIVSILLNIALSPILLVILAFRIIGLVIGVIKNIIYDIRNGGGSYSYSSSDYDDDYSSGYTPTRNKSGFEGRLASLLRSNMDAGRDLLGSGGTYCKSLNFRGFNVNVNGGSIRLTGTIEYHLDSDSIGRAMRNGYNENSIGYDLKRDMQNVMDKACDRAVRSCNKIAPTIMGEYGIDYDINVYPEFNIQAVE